MKVASDQNCFVCGPENRIGLNANFLVDEQNRTSEVSVSLPESYQGWQGVVHGGIISALLDEAAIYACRPILLHGVTAELNIRFRKPVPTKTEVKIQAAVVSLKRKIALVRSSMFCNGELMAEADVKVLLLDNSREV